MTEDDPGDEWEAAIRAVTDRWRRKTLIPNDNAMLKVSCWHGRRSADPATIHCSRNGWAEQNWERDAKGCWEMVSMTLRPVIGYLRTEIGDPQVTFGPARVVFPTGAL